MKSVCFVDPFRCRMWNFHNRLESEITEETCKMEIQSFHKHGQLIPVLGRAIQGDPEHDVELIYGARRLFAARNLGKRLAVELRDISDREAIVAMDMENRLRKDVSAVERGRCFARWLQAGYFDSQEALARALSMSASQVSRLLKVARLPLTIVAAFASPLDIRERWGLELANAIEDAQSERAILRAARDLCSTSPRPAPNVIFRKLIASAVCGAETTSNPREEIVLDDHRSPLFRLRRQSKSIALILPGDRASDACLERIQAAVTEILQDGVWSAEMERN